MDTDDVQNICFFNNVAKTSCFKNLQKKATMLKKNKGKMKRRNTEPAMIVAGSPAPPMSLSIQQTPSSIHQTDESGPEDTEPNNTDF